MLMSLIATTVPMNRTWTLIVSPAETVSTVCGAPTVVVVLAPLTVVVVGVLVMDDFVSMAMTASSVTLPGMMIRSTISPGANDTCFAPAAGMGAGVVLGARFASPRASEMVPDTTLMLTLALQTGSSLSLTGESSKPFRSQVVMDMSIGIVISPRCRLVTS